MRLVFAGTPQPAVPALQVLLDSGHEVAAVVTRPDARAGRGRTLRPGPVAALAREAGVPVLQPVSARRGLAEQLAEIAPDCCPVVAYGQLLPPEVLVVPRLGWVNLHFSLLPAYRGAAPVQWALIRGEELTGATAFLLDEGMDTGPILGSLTEVIRPGDTAGDLLDRLSAAGAHLLLATLDAMEAGSIEAVRQPTDGVSMAPKITAQDARIDWTAPALAVERMTRAMTPAPGAWTTWEDLRVKISPVEPVSGHPRLAPGQVAFDGHVVVVGTGSDPVRLTGVQPAGKKLMEAAAWARGAHTAGGAGLDGAVFESEGE